MNLDWITTPLFQYALLAAGMAACLWLFLTSKLETAGLSTRTKKDGEALQAQLHGMEKELGQLRDRLAEISDRPPTPEGPSLNLTRRAKAIRMQQRGESAETIAAALGTPRNEVELLLKLQKQLQPACPE